MKKNLILMLLAMFAVFDLSAVPVATVPVATLNHDGQITQYNGSNALQAAHNDAVSGDVITLNNGIFSACTISKGIILRGACMDTTPEMEEQGMRPTIIQTDMHIQVPATETNTLKIEDLQFYNHLYVDSVPHISFARVKTRQYIYTKATIDNFDAVQCSFYHLQSNGGTNPATVYTFVNCAIAFTGYSYNPIYLPRYINADHCVIGAVYDHGGGSGCVFKNCIFTEGNTSSSYKLPDNCIVNNCVAVKNGLFSGCTAIDCQVVSLATLFDDQEHTGFSNGGYINPLTEEAAATYLGTDGTQVGIYGGVLPFTMMPDNPIVTQCDIAGKTNEDGKLKVKIEVKSVNQ